MIMSAFRRWEICCASAQLPNYHSQLKQGFMKRSAFIISAIALSAFLAGCENMQTQNAAAAPAATAQKAPAGAPSTPPAQPPQTAGAAQPAQGAQQQQGAPVTFLLAQKTQAKGLTELKLQNGTLWYAPQPVLTRADLARVTPLKAQNGQGAVRFDFSPEGAQKLANITQRNKGRFLVIVVGDQLVSVPEIDAQLKDGALGFPTANEAQAQAIVDAIRGGAQK